MRNKQEQPRAKAIRGHISCVAPDFLDAKRTEGSIVGITNRFDGKRHGTACDHNVLNSKGAITSGSKVLNRHVAAGAGHHNSGLLSNHKGNCLRCRHVGGAGALLLLAALLLAALLLLALLLLLANCCVLSNGTERVALDTSVSRQRNIVHKENIYSSSW